MAGNFWYPYHWSDLAPDAFVKAPIDHDAHGFGPGFVARQEDRDRYLEDYLNGLSAGGGRRYSTMVIAAYNSVHHLAADADYVCTGTNDDAVINQAVTAIRAVSGFGQIVLLDGSFIFGTTGANGQGFVSIRGMGGGGPETSIDFPASVPSGYVGLTSFNTVADLFISAWGTHGATAPIAIKNAQEVRSCVLSGGSHGGTGLSLAAGLPGMARAHNLYVTGYDTGIAVGSNQRVSGCYVSTCATYGIQADGASESHVTDNHVESCTGYGIHSSSTTTKSQFDLNQVVKCCSSGWATVVDGTDNHWRNNVVRDGGTGALYGMNVVSTASGCVVVMNDLHDTTWVTGSFIDSGTGTVKNFDGSANNWNRL